VLQQAEGSDFGRSASASTMIVLIEVAVSLLGVVILGLGSWTSWLRPVIIIGVLVFAVMITLVYRLYHGAAGTPRWMSKNRHLCGVLDGLRTFREGTRDLLHPRVLTVPVLLGTLYLIIAGSGLFIVARGVGEDSLTFTQALAAYFFSLAFSLIFPLPIDIGVAEVSGVGALVALGVDRNAAISIMLVNRVLTLGASITIAMGTALVLHDEFALAFGRDKRAKSSEQAGSEG
ncbi:MAG TPA: lysylphosphatidylglycerol synthase transmembrane domain-containing protein, partial [Chloroflexota bacterium]|nr:lysylphosphatidylglycerol synthase transmembrane domain-containing protein [Chloroflexota bacterium]